MVITFNHEILMDLNVRSTPEYAEVVFGTVSVGMSPSLVPEWLGGFYSYPVIKSLMCNAFASVLKYVQVELSYETWFT